LQKVLAGLPQHDAFPATPAIRRTEIIRNPGRHGARLSMASKSTMVGLDRSQRRVLAETVRDIANIAAGAMIFGQFVAGAPFSIPVAIFGGVFWILCAGGEVIIAKGSES
jgi:hypothetical protein